MAEFVANRANPDFLRDFRKRNENQPTLSFSNESGDVVTVNKEFLCSIGSAEEGGEDDEEEEKREYDFLAMNSELSPENYDFSDPAALLRRQRELLKEIEDQKAKEESVDVFALLRQRIEKWAIILCHGGKFAIALFKGARLVSHKSDSKYVIRKKSGGR